MSTRDMKNRRWPFKALAALLLAAGAVLFLFPELLTSRQPTPMWGFFLVVAGVYCYNMARRQRLRDAAANLKPLKATEAPVVYLRSFAADKQGYRPRTEEEQLAEVLGNFGPCMAIGRPKEALPMLGFRREYVADAEWQDVVSGWLQRAALVVVRLGTTSGLRWELERCRQIVDPVKLVLLVPAGRAARKAAREILGDLFGVVDAQLPGRSGRAQRINALVHFDRDWKAQVVKTRMPLFRVNAIAYWQPMFQLAFRPVFERLGQPWSPPPIGWASILSVLGFVLLIGIAEWLKWLFSLL